MKRPLLVLSALAFLMAPSAAGAQSIEPYRAQEVQPYQAQEVKPYQAQTVQPYQAQTVKPYQAQTVKPRRAEAVQQRRKRTGYREAKRGKAPQGLTEAQIKAYGALNHNIGVWYSGQDFTMQPAR